MHTKGVVNLKELFQTVWLEHKKMDTNFVLVEIHNSIKIFL